MRGIKLIKRIKFTGLELSLTTTGGRAPIIPVYICDTIYVPGVAESKRTITTITFSEEEVEVYGDKFDHSDYIIVVGKKFTNYSRRTQTYLIFREYLNSASIDLNKYSLPVLEDTDLVMVSEGDEDLMREAIALAKFGGMRKMVAEYAVNKLKKKSVKTSAKIIKESKDSTSATVDGFYATGVPLKLFESNIELSTEDKEDILELVKKVSDLIDRDASKKEIIRTVLHEVNSHESLNAAKVITTLATSDIISEATRNKIMKYIEEVSNGFNFKTMLGMI